MATEKRKESAVIKEKPPIPPLKITDDLYWVGARTNAPAHLLVTGAGLVLIDTGTTDTADIVIGNIEKMGFDIREVKHIIHSHGHYDHVGATNRIVELSGAKTYVGRGDVDAVIGKNDLLWGGYGKPDPAFYFKPDVIIEDNDVIAFGNTVMRFLATPGHTAGVISMFWNTRYKGVDYLAGMFGGAGHGALSDEYLDSKGLPRTLREDYVRSIKRIIKEPVEVHIGNHPGNNSHLIKAARLTDSYNPFIEERTWVPFLEKMRDKLIADYNIEM